MDITHDHDDLVMWEMVIQIRGRVERRDDGRSIFTYSAIFVEQLFPKTRETQQYCLSSLHPFRQSHPHYRQLLSPIAPPSRPFTSKPRVQEIVHRRDAAAQKSTQLTHAIVL
jgi:hypothetical protein